MPFFWNNPVLRRNHSNGVREVPWRQIRVEEEWMPGHYGPSQVYYIAGSRFVIGALQESEQVEETLGERWEDKTERELFDQLSEHIA